MSNKAKDYKKLLSKLEAYFGQNDGEYAIMHLEVEGLGHVIFNNDEFQVSTDVLYRGTELLVIDEVGEEPMIPPMARFLSLSAVADFIIANDGWKPETKVIQISDYLKK
jgi:hypothetical protein